MDEQERTARKDIIKLLKTIAKAPIDCGCKDCQRMNKLVKELREKYLKKVN